MSSGFCGTQNTSGFYRKVKYPQVFAKAKYQQVLSQDKYQQQSSRHAFGPAETKGPLQAAFMLSKPRMRGQRNKRYFASGKNRTGNTIFAFGKNRSVFCLTAKTG